MEQVRLAFSQKIRVYLQNTKSEHASWVEKYQGTIDVNAPHINIDEMTDETQDEIHPDDLPKSENMGDDSFNDFPPLSDVMSEPLSLGLRSTLDSLDTPEAKRAKENP